MATPTMSSQLAMSINPSQPEVTNVYDAAKGHYYDSVCHTPAAPAYMALPGTPMPFANLKNVK